MLVSSIAWPLDKHDAYAGIGLLKSSFSNGVWCLVRVLYNRVEWTYCLEVYGVLVWATDVYSSPEMSNHSS